MGAKGPPRLEGSTEGGEETTPALFEVSGSVKWFDPSKGYGIIIPDDDLPEILLHVTRLRRGGFQTACEGARTVCEVMRSSKGSAGCARLQHGRFHSDPSIAVAEAHPCRRRPRERLGKSGGQVVQPTTRVWLSNPWSPDARYFCAYGNTPAIWFYRTQAWPGALWQGIEWSYGSGTEARQRFGSILSLTAATKASRRGQAFTNTSEPRRAGWTRCPFMALSGHARERALGLLLTRSGHPCSQSRRPRIAEPTNWLAP